MRHVWRPKPGLRNFPSKEFSWSLEHTYLCYLLHINPKLICFTCNPSLPCCSHVRKQWVMQKSSAHHQLFSNKCVHGFQSGMKDGSNSTCPGLVTQLWNLKKKGLCTIDAGAELRESWILFRIPRSCRYASPCITKPAQLLLWLSLMAMSRASFQCTRSVNTHVS